MQHDDRTLVTLGGHFHEPSVLSDLQVDADAIHHAGHRLDLVRSENCNFSTVEWSSSHA